ncbi:phosphate ABC transporter substrate-binding protein [Bosea vaviloviae]|uniref:PBP domain-containing protein n=1 Tax=Bosea vaviloviae TaxID=1526658 RepID=A0A1D7U7H9_9HYPH|nr:phosphate ABC transporter substrate-binding protein [Bosea vaviloviae]AOO83330.1 hypothetical protein BHK69_25360 [Bosea vaviloviae]
MTASQDLRTLRRAAFLALPLLAIAALAAVYLLDDGRDAAQDSGSLQILGSETMRPLVTACAEAFMARNPQADIVVRGGGSGDGVAALLNGMIDIGMTSRPLSDKERDFAATRGIDLAISDLAIDGIAVIVNGANPLSALSLDRLKAVFTGEVANWRDLGGADRPVLVFGRAAGSGTATLFTDRVLGGAAETPGAQKLATNEAIVTEVAARPDAIGYTSLGAVRNAGNRIRLVALGAAGSAAVAPTPETLRNGAYPLGRMLFFGVAGAVSSTARAFIDSCAGQAGQALIQRAGYVPLQAGSR